MGTTKRKKKSVIRAFGETLSANFGKAEEIMLDTGPQEGKYRVVANLKRKVCPECRNIHYSALPLDTCLGCTAILKEEKRTGRKMTRSERLSFLKRIGL